jgi:hypothetical protein
MYDMCLLSSSSRKLLRASQSMSITCLREPIGRMQGRILRRSTAVSIGNVTHGRTYTYCLIFFFPRWLHACMPSPSRTAKLKLYYLFYNFPNRTSTHLPLASVHLGLYRRFRLSLLSLLCVVNIHIYTWYLFISIYF